MQNNTEAGRIAEVDSADRELVLKPRVKPKLKRRVRMSLGTRVWPKPRVPRVVTT